MEISKNSWHYKLITDGVFRSTPPNNLCQYITRLLSVLIIESAMVGTIVSTLFGLYLLYISGGEVIGVDNFMYMFSQIGAVFLLFFIMVSIVAISLVGVIMSIIFVLHKIFDKPDNKNIIGEYFKSLKEKTCYTLTFKD